MISNKHSMTYCWVGHCTVDVLSWLHLMLVECWKLHAYCLQHWLTARVTNFVNGACCCCRQYIQSLPAAEDPEVFGMHENANIAYELRETRRVLDTVLAMQPRLGNSPGTTSPDQQVTTIAASILDRFALIACLCSTHTQLLLSLEPNRILHYVCLLG